MNQAKSLTSAFGRSALRQPESTALLLLPSLLGLMIRPIPILLARYFPLFDSSRWIPLFLSVAACFPAYLFGLPTSLMLLDERDRNLLPALMVTPVTDRGLLAAKVFPALILALTGTPIALALSGQLFRISPGAVIAAALIAVPSAAFYTLAAGYEEVFRGLTSEGALNRLEAPHPASHRRAAVRPV